MKSISFLVVLCLSIIVGSGQSDTTTLVARYRKDLEANPKSSLAHFRIGELFFQEKRYVDAVNEFRQALNGDLQPKWTKVWSYIDRAKIFDVTGQRDRAIFEYRQAERTNDNTRGALDEAVKYMNLPYTGK